MFCVLSTLNQYKVSLVARSVVRTHGSDLDMYVLGLAGLLAGFHIALCCAVTAGMVIVGKALRGDDDAMTFTGVGRLVSLAHVPLCVWAAAMAVFLYSDAMSLHSVDALNSLMEQSLRARSLSYAAAVCWLVMLAADRFKLRYREAVAVVGTPVIVLALAGMALNAMIMAIQ